MTDRPILALEHDAAAVEEFVAGLQAAVDASDPELFNQAFARDVLWGSPFGLVVSGYDEIHSIHSKMFAAARERQERAEHDASGAQTGRRARYEIEHARLVAEDVAIAYVRRFNLLGDKDDDEDQHSQEPQPGRGDTFDELALFVLVRRDGAWWLAAGLHTPDRRDVYR